MHACVCAALLGADMRRMSAHSIFFFNFIIFSNKKIEICAGARADAIIGVRVHVVAGKNSLSEFCHKPCVTKSPTKRQM